MCFSAIDATQKVPLHTRALRYFGLVEDPASQVELRRPVYGLARWIGLGIAAAFVACLALRIGGADWSAIAIQVGIVYPAGVVAGWVLYRLRWGDRTPASVVSPPASAKVHSSGWPWVNIAFIALGVILGAADSWRQVNAVVSAGLWLGLGVASETRHRRIERQLGVAVSAGSDGSYYVVDRQAGRQI